MKIVALVENNIPKDAAKKYQDKLQAEHGLSIYVEYKDRHYLLDTGSTGIFADNADILGIDLSAIDVGILSHAHYDHSGGYEEFFKRNQRARVYIRKEAKEKCYVQSQAARRYIGIPENLLEKWEERFVYVDGDFEIEKGVWLIAHKDKDLTIHARRHHMYRQTRDGFLEDDFKHEQSLVFKTENGLVILNSCCHGGVDTIIGEVKTAFPGQRIKAVIGGFHLKGEKGIHSMAGEPEKIKELAGRLKELGVEEIYTGHCTGEPAFRILREELDNRLKYFGTGCVIEYE